MIPLGYFVFLNLIELLLNDILWGWRRKRAYIFTVFFGGKGEGYCNASMTLIFGGFRDPVKNGGETDCCMQQFSRGFWTLLGPANVL